MPMSSTSWTDWATNGPWGPNTGRAARPSRPWPGSPGLRGSPSEAGRTGRQNAALPDLGRDLSAGQGRMGHRHASPGPGPGRDRRIAGRSPDAPPSNPGVAHGLDHRPAHLHADPSLSNGTGKVRPQTDRKNAFAGTSDEGHETGIEPTPPHQRLNSFETRPLIVLSNSAPANSVPSARPAGTSGARCSLA